MQRTSIVGNLLTTTLAPIVLFVQFPTEHESSVPGRHQEPLGHLVRVQGPCHIPRGAGQMAALATIKEDVNILKKYIYSRLLKIDAVCPPSWSTNHLSVSGVFVVPSLGSVWAAMQKSTLPVSPRKMYYLVTL